MENWLLPQTLGTTCQSSKTWPLFYCTKFYQCLTECPLMTTTLLPLTFLVQRTRERKCDTHHADETLVSISSQYLPLQLSDSSLQSLHGGSRGFLLCYPEKRNGNRWKELVFTLEDISTDMRQCVKFHTRNHWQQVIDIYNIEKIFL